MRWTGSHIQNFGERRSVNGGWNLVSRHGYSCKECKIWKMVAIMAQNSAVIKVWSRVWIFFFIPGLRFM